MYILRLVLGLWPLLLAGCTSSSPTSSFATLDDCKFGERPMVVQNNSSQNIWVGITSGAQTCASNSDCATGETCTPGGGATLNPAHASSGSSCSCGTTGQCATGATCGLSSNPKICYLNQPRIYSQIKNSNAGASTKLPKGSSLALCSPKAIEPGVNPVQWSGTIFARTGCDSNGQNCLSANCPTNSADDSCQAGRGGVAPVTVAEFTLQNPASQNLTDYYDVSMIDGVNLAVSIKAGIPTSQPKATLATGSSYRCGSPGLHCPWRVVPPKGHDLLFKQAGLGNGATGTACTADANCTKTGEICGLALLSNGKAKFGNVCGPLVGYWSGSQICSNTRGMTPAQAGPIGALKCTTTTTSNQLVSDLFSCTGTAPASCYTPRSTDTCCGCPTDSKSKAKWPATLTVPPPALNDINAAVCSGNNTEWETYVVPYIQFLKDACPTAYAFPFDDATSTFQCNSSGSGDANMTPGYTITFSDLK